MREADLATELLQAESVGMHQRLHHASLRTGQVPSRNVALKWLPEHLADGAELPVDLLRQFDQLFAFAHG